MNVTIPIPDYIVDKCQEKDIPDDKIAAVFEAYINFRLGTDVGELAPEFADWIFEDINYIDIVNS